MIYNAPVIQPPNLQTLFLDSQSSLPCHLTQLGSLSLLVLDSSWLHGSFISRSGYTLWRPVLQASLLTVPKLRVCCWLFPNFCSKLETGRN